MLRREKAAERRADPGLKAAIEKIGVSGIACACGVTAASVSDWKRIPAERVAAVAQASSLPKSTLRPDLYDREAAA